MPNETPDQSLKKISPQINPQGFWEKKKVTWTVEEKVIEHVKKFNNKKARELAVVVGCVVGLLFAGGAVATKDSRLSWKLDVTTEILGGGVIACILGFALGLLTFKIVKCCSPPSFENNNKALKAYISKDLQKIYAEYGNRLQDEDLKKYWVNGILKDDKNDSIKELRNEARRELDPVAESTPLIPPGP